MNGQPKSVLCIAYSFPPSVHSGTHRTRAVVRHLPAFGWRPVVVTVQEDNPGSGNPRLLQGLPEDLAVYRTPNPDLVGIGSRCWSWTKRLCSLGLAGKPARGHGNGSLNGHSRKGLVDWASWWLHVPDTKIGWLPFGLKAARQAVRFHKCQAIYSSAPFWTVHLIGLLTKRLTGLPWLADFRDPWRANPFRKVPYRTLDRFDAWLEKQTIHGADRVICNTERVCADFQFRYPALASKFVTVFNGFDPEDYVGLEPLRPAVTKKLVLTHAGNFYGPRRPDALFQALRLLRGRPDLNFEICLQLLGTPTYHGRALQAIAAENGVEDMVLVQGDLPHRQALELLYGSDIQVLVGFSGTGADLQVPAKLFEYFGTGRPILALAPPQSAIADIMARAGNPGELCEPDDPQAIARAIERMAASANGSSSLDSAGNCFESLKQFHRRDQVGQIADLLNMMQ